VRAWSLPENYTQTRLVLPDGLSFEKWLEIGKTLGKAGSSVMWWLGDWWVYGEHRYGERVKAAVESDYSFQTLMDAGWVSRQVGTSDRSEVLSWGHHWQVASLEAVDQRVMLKRAEECKWSVRELKREVGRMRTQRLESSTPSFPSGRVCGYQCRGRGRPGVIGSPH
jgi:hypothetical protein